MRTAIITTTISEPTSALAAFCRQHDATVIVAGDMVVPPELPRLLSRGDHVWLSLEEQAHRWPELSRIVGMRTIQRRNFALLYALEEDYDVIITVDDDNAPVLSIEEWLGHHLDQLFGDARPYWYTDTPATLVNPGDLLKPRVIARGMPVPYNTLPWAPWRPARQPSYQPIAVSAGLTVGDPDIDAYTRMATHPMCDGVDPTGVELRKGFAPLNSQNTAWKKDAAFLMAVWPGIGRYDDIWAGYVAELLLQRRGRSICFGEPATFSARNDHNVVVDLQHEIFGYEHTPAFLRFLLDWDGDEIGADMHLDFKNLVRNLPFFIPSQTRDFLQCWAEQVQPANTADVE